MTDTPTPPAMTPEQRAATVYALVNLHNIDPDNLAAQLEADGVTIATLTADRDGLIALAEDLSGGLFDANKERDAAQAEMAARIGSAREVISRLTKINVKLCADFNLMNQNGAKQDAEIARLTAALATAREDGMREAANSALQAAGQEYVLVHASENEEARMGRHSAVRGMMVRMGIYAELEDAIEAAITKGAAT